MSQKTGVQVCLNFSNDPLQARLQPFTRRQSPSLFDQHVLQHQMSIEPRCISSQTSKASWSIGGTSYWQLCSLPL